ncbi:FAD-dependent oxidoreductase [Altererythrobacter sp.]|uniref:FAD-dependent oxidoreductase n=1 Tax=Altererythrobacter sp. TaxID=1872480 RepID=UPI001B2AB6FB|nr:FAD-dependent oxidoreductase [Altererythrobacter sp.]MBO6641590.1 FAD-dependent oxidoreductase [Altererythrobacter sp.]MBO6707711.1 FAD-dependent oxidoreductase [Altererythrobacter sp.]MBO6946157.1 FAD-dependent oxidoreductase [Altererythrobacter sp.]
MRHIAIIGSGPAGYYTAEAAQKLWGDDVRVDIFDMLPVPYGLIRFGVAPDHQSIKGVSRRYEKTALNENVHFIGNVRVGEDITVPELQSMYDAVVLATGAPNDRELDLPGKELSNIFGSAAMVGWYNGHPQFADLAPDLSGQHAVVIGMGNVALDIARILAKTEAEFEGADIVSHALQTLLSSNIRSITILGRRGPHQIMMTPKELGELAVLERASPRVDRDDLPEEEEDMVLEPGLRKSVNHLRSFAAIPESVHAEKPIEIHFDMFASPRAFEGDGKVQRVLVERTEVKQGRAVGTGETYTVPADIVVSCIGYRSSPIPDVPFDERAGKFANDGGRILPGIYCVGWAKRGPSGTIGTNRPDGFGVVDLIAEDLSSGVLGRSDKKGREAFDTLAKERDLDVVTFRDWKKIEEAEAAAARDGSPREKFVEIEAMIRAKG